MSNDIQAECTGYDFALGSIHGVRSFKADTLGRLRGVSVPHVWTPGENVASCRKDDAAYGYGSYASLYRTLGLTVPATYQAPEKDKKHQGIDPSCTCGFYAYHDGIADYGQDTETLTGIVECYGKTTVGTRGVRSEKARIVALVEPIRRRTTVGLIGGVVLAFAAVLPIAWLIYAMARWPDPSMALATGSTIFGIVGPVGLGAASWYFLRKPSGRSKLTRTRVNAIRGNYPDVPWFRTTKDALRAFPMREALAPSPETDPTFWVRPS